MKEEFALKTIGEVSKSLNIPQYVIRFWEKKFSTVKPIQRSKGRRYYTNENIENLIIIKDLLYEKRYSIKGAQKIIEKKKEEPNNIKSLNIENIINKLKSLREELKKSI